VGGAVCYEAVYSAHGRRLAARGAEVFVNVTNDAWYWRTAATWQHALGPVSRAVECGRDLVRCANTGATLAASPDAKVVGGVPLFMPGIQIVDARLLHGLTAYVRWGDAPFLLLVGLAAVLSWRRSRRAP
jgi:apolipoprotein N-acyltransferase